MRLPAFTGECLRFHGRRPRFGGPVVSAHAFSAMNSNLPAEPLTSRRLPVPPKPHRVPSVRLGLGCFHLAPRDGHQASSARNAFHRQKLSILSNRSPSPFHTPLAFCHRGPVFQDPAWVCLPSHLSMAFWLAGVASCACARDSPPAIHAACRLLQFPHNPRSHPRAHGPFSPQRTVFWQ